MRTDFPEDQQNGYHFSCLLIILVFAYAGGAGAHFATQGLNPDADSKFKNWKLLPLVKGFLFPTLLAQLLWGALASNGLREYFDDYYDDYWGYWIRNFGTAVILVRVGGELDFKGKGLMFVLFSIIPNACEAIGIGILARFLLDIPWEFAFSLGFLVSVVSPALMVPVTLKFREQNYSPRVADLLLSSSAFMVGVSVALFSVFNTIGMMNYGNTGSGIGELISDILKQIFVGVGMPLIMSLPMIPLRKQSDLVKSICILILLEITMWFLTYSNMPIGSVLGQIFFGYGCKINLGGKMPSWHLKYIWYICMPFLFGHVGTQINLSKMVPAAVGYSFAIVVVGILLRGISAFFVSGMNKKFDVRERIFIGIASVSKATCQCSMGGTLLAATLSKDALKSLEGSGNNLLTCSVFSVILAGPLSALLMENLYPKLLKMKRPKALAKHINSALTLNHETDASDIDFVRGKQDSLARPLLDED